MNWNNVLEFLLLIFILDIMQCLSIMEDERFTPFPPMFLTYMYYLSFILSFWYDYIIILIRVMSVYFIMIMYKLALGEKNLKSDDLFFPV